MKKKSSAIFIFMVAVLTLLLVGAAMSATERGFTIRSFSPQGLTEGPVQIKAQFSHPVVSEDEVDKNLTLAQFPFVFTPHLEGRGKWEDSSTFVLTPTGGVLYPAMRYTATVLPGLIDKTGRRLTGAKSFQFNSAPLRFIEAKQSGINYERQEVLFTLDFSQQISPNMLYGYLSVRGDKGPVAFTVYTHRNSNKTAVLGIRHDLEAGKAEAVIAKDFPPAHGSLGLEKAVRFKLNHVLTMEVLDANVESGTQTSSVIFNTSMPVDFAKISSFIKVTPEQKYTVNPRSHGFAVTGNFKPQDRVTVTVKQGLPSVMGGALKEEWQRAFVFPDKHPSIEFESSWRVITPAGLLRIPLESVNIDRIKVFAWKLYENNIPYALRSSWYEFPMDLSEQVFYNSYTVAGKPNEVVRRALDLRPVTSGDKGVFLISARNDKDGQYWMETSTVLNVTDLGVTAKVGQDSVFAWVNSIQTGEPVYGAKVTFWSYANQPIAIAETDIRGIAVAELKDPKQQAPVLATVAKGDDIAFVKLNNGLFGGSGEIDTSGRAWLRNGYEAYCYLPRDIFRPGEKVSFRAVVRDANNAAPKPFPLTARFTAPTGKVWLERTAKLTAEGTFAADVDLPAEAPLGSWTATLHAPGVNAAIGYKSFLIEEFAPPRLVVGTAADKHRLVGVDEAVLSISSRYVFGALAEDLPWEAEQNVIPITFHPAGWSGYSFYDTEAGFDAGSDFIGSGRLDEKGEAVAAINSKMWRTSSMARIAARAGVMEEGGRWVYKTVTVDWFPRNVMLGIKMPQETALNKKFEFQAAAVDPDGKAAGTKKLKYKIFRQVWQTVVYEENGRRQSRSQRDLQERGGGEISLSEGSGSASFMPPQGGTYLLRVEDAESGAKASLYFSVYDYHGEEFDIAEEETNLPDKVELMTDKQEYKPGEIVKVKVKAPFTGRVLLSVETHKVVHRVVQDMKGREEVEISFRANEFMLPNAWLTAQVIRSGEDTPRGEPFRSFGAAALALDNSGTLLTVDMEEIGTIEPGPLDVDLTVKDERGRGTAAEVTVMLVDETVLGLTGYRSPDPWSFFTERRMLGMETFDLYNLIIAPEDEQTQLLTAGGGGALDELAMAARDALSPVKAQRFKILTLTQTVKTGSNGKATAHFDVPEFAGAARLTAVAVSAKASGSTDGRLAINREVVLEPSLPRALAPDDVLTVPLTLFNMSSRDIDVRVGIKPDGPIRLEGEDKFIVSLNAASTASRQLKFTGTGFGVARVAFTAEWPEGKIADEIELPVRPAAPRVSISEAGLVEKNRNYKVDLSGDWFKGTRQGQVMLSAMPQIAMADVAQYLITYPHGCLEQTVSSAWAPLVMPELVAAVDPELAPKEALKGSLQMRIAKIRGMQNYDGGFMRWPGYNWGAAWDSMYATHFLVEAKRRGADVPQKSLTSALNYVRLQLNAMPRHDGAGEWKMTLTRRAYACYVLALSGEKQLGWMSSLLDRQKELPPAARLLLAAAYGEAGENKIAESLLTKTLEVIKSEPGGNEIYDSNLRNKALLLLAHTHIDPLSAEAASAAFSVMNSFRTSRYYSTQEGGFSLLALARYYSAQPAEGKPAGSIEDGSGKTVAKLNETSRTISASIGDSESFTFINTGESKLFVAATVSGVPTKPVAPVDNGITIRQWVKDRNGDEITDSVARGEALTATVEIIPKAGTLRNIVVSIPLAAGLEVENPQLAEGSGSLPYNARVEQRDDRVLLFIDALSGKMKWSYSLRQVTAGRFTVPQYSAECMYDPAIQSIFGGGVLEITD